MIALINIYDSEGGRRGMIPGMKLIWALEIEVIKTESCGEIRVY
jgi:hypothetical protein